MAVATFFAARFCVPLAGKRISVNPNLLALRAQSFNQVKHFSEQSRAAFRRSLSWKERMLLTDQRIATKVGNGLLVGASAFGIGSLCYYGLGLSTEPGAVEKSMIWPKHVKDRIRSTYAYFGGSIAITAITAYAVFRSPKLMTIMLNNSWLNIFATFAAMIGSGMIVRSMPYSEGLNGKHLAWLVHSSIMGVVVAPLCFFGGPILIRAAWYTAGIVAGLSSVAACAPSEKFLNWGGPLACGLGVVFVSSLGSIFVPATTALGAGLYGISMYGGLVIFGGFLLYDTQRIVHMAENYPLYGYKPYDPINTSISIYLDTLNIFIRIAMLLAGGNRKK